MAATALLSERSVSRECSSARWGHSSPTTTSPHTHSPAQRLLITHPSHSPHRLHHPLTSILPSISPSTFSSLSPTPTFPYPTHYLLPSPQLAVMSASFVSLRWVVALLVVLVLVQTKLASSQAVMKFNFLLTTVENTYNGVSYSVTLSAVLTGTEQGVGTGAYLITAARGTRTFDSLSGAPVRAVNVDLYGGFQPDNLLYFPPFLSSPDGAYLSENGIGFTLSAAQTILPTDPDSKFVNVFLNDGTTDYAESDPNNANAGYTLVVTQYVPGMGGDPVLNGFHGQRFLVKACPTACTTCCRCPACSSTRASSLCRPARP